MRSAVDMSDTLHRLTRTEGVPAYMKALVRPTIPSPLTSFPRPVWHADKTTRSAFKSRLKISAALRKPSSLDPFSFVKTRELKSGLSSLINPWVAKWIILNLSKSLICLKLSSVAFSFRRISEDPVLNNEAIFSTSAPLYFSGGYFAHS